MLLGELAALTAAALWGLTSVFFFSVAAQRIGALRVNLFRLPLGWVMLGLTLLTTGSKLTTDPTSLALLAASGIVGLALGDLAYFATLRRIGPRLTVLLQSLAPLFATGFGVVLLDEVPGPLAGVGIALTLGGVVWVVRERPDAARPAGHHTSGVVLGVLAALCQGLGLVLSKMGMAGGLGPWPASWLRMSFATAALWIGAAVAGRLRDLALRPSLRAAWLQVVGGAALGPFLGASLSLVAAQLTEVGVAATLMATTPIIVIPLVVHTERYRPTWRAVAGTVLAVAGIALLFAR
ncbi:MAG: DMT family transporter [Thermoanaerobaculaceae bacterium]|nr:DMT family transporter [Thermoanaerobaculaceae bacterium]MDI9620640.1 DMT family transporter [Acidobacteriota bacterium]NLH10249.1 DMT family transporter [Holophagae bacterium]HPW55284.1 DMT family transporter [Thermoanaerobaculaceae bacterium]